MDWIAANSELLNVAANVGMLVVWITYLQVFLAGYNRQKKAKILINLGGGTGLQAHCLVTNMSAEPVYIHTLTAELRYPDGSISARVTEMGDAEKWQEPSELNLWTRQGPLESGRVRDMGTMQSIIDHVRHQSVATPRSAGQDNLEEIRLRIVAEYGSEDLLVGAERVFGTKFSAGEVHLRPQTLTAVQIRSPGERRRMVDELRKEERQASL